MEFAKKILTKLTPSRTGLVKKVNEQLSIAEETPSPRISLLGHSILAFLFVGGVLAYFIFAVVSFTVRPEVESFSQRSSSNFPRTELKITTSCSNPPFCGNITIQANYSNTPGCQAFSKRVVIPNTATGTPTETLVTLCFNEPEAFSVETRAFLFVQGVQVDFGAINPGETDPVTKTPDPARAAKGLVIVESLDGRLNKVVNMDSWQVKGLMLQGNINMHEGEVKGSRLVPVAIEYDGKRPNWRATLLLRMSSYITVSDRSRPGSIVTVLASVGGAASIISAFLLLLAPVLGMLLPGNFQERPVGKN